ncbi:MAG TPA: SDR family oxidoreductase [Methylovirgula sp.]|nr:SDR family oxidoreductase [Methylovirgula sp.]
MNFFGFGLGYCAQDFLARHGAQFDSIAGTVRSKDAAERLGGAQAYVFDSERADPGIADALAESDVLLVSIPPDASVDPVLAKFGRQLAKLDRPLTIVYLSTLGVYGDRGGEWVDETRLPVPKHERSIARLRAEKAWLALARDGRKTIHILRLAGIYGPGRNALVNLRNGTARRIVKQDQVFNRIHVADVSAAIAAVLAYDGGEIWNAADDEPAPPQDVIAYAAKLMGIAPPPEQAIDTVELSPLARSFYDENKRASNRKMKEKLGVALAYPTYREGLAALWDAGEGRG